MKTWNTPELTVLEISETAGNGKNPPPYRDSNGICTKTNLPCIKPNAQGGGICNNCTGYNSNNIPGDTSGETPGDPTDFTS